MSEYTELARRVRHDLIKNLDIPEEDTKISAPELRVLDHRLFDPQTGMCVMSQVWAERIRQSPVYETDFDLVIDEILRNAHIIKNMRQTLQTLLIKAPVEVPTRMIQALTSLVCAVNQFELFCNQREDTANASHFDVANAFDAPLTDAGLGAFDADELAALDFMGIDMTSDDVMTFKAQDTPDKSSHFPRPASMNTEVMSDEDASKIRVLVVDDQLISVERLRARASMQNKFSWVNTCTRGCHCDKCEHANRCEHFRARSWQDLIRTLRHETSHGGRVDLLLMDVRFDTLDKRELLWIPQMPALNDENHVKALQGLIIARALRMSDEFSQLPIVLMTARSQLPDGANRLLKGLEGLQFVDDDSSLDALAARMEDVARQNRETHDDTAFFWGNTPRMQEVRRQAELMSIGPRTILITGPSGAGKSYIVENVIYPNSGRHPLVTLDLSSVPENLVESELFGHVKGAFSGATHDRPGLIEEARGGILFLDEIGNLSPENQKKLLLFLNDKMVRRVGAAFTTRHHVDVKVVAATHLDLAKEVDAGRFRFDLYMRLAPALTIHLPTLAERKQDLGALIKMLVIRQAKNDEMRPFIEQYAKLCNVKPNLNVEFGNENLTRPKNELTLRFPQATRELFETYDWPGNTRELESILDALVIKTFYDVRYGGFAGNTLEIDHYRAMSLLGLLNDEKQALTTETNQPDEPKTSDTSWLPTGPFDGFTELRAQIERAYLTQAYQRAKGDMATLALMLFNDSSTKTQHKIAVRLNQLGLRIREMKK